MARAQKKDLAPANVRDPKHAAQGQRDRDKNNARIDKAEQHLADARKAAQRIDNGPLASKRK